MALYPPFVPRDRLPSPAIVDIGATWLAPYGLAHWGGDISGLIRRFTSEQGLSLFARSSGPAILETYCQARFGGTLY